MNPAAPAQSGTDSYVYDPLDTRPAELEQEDVEAFITDQRYPLNLYGNGVVYHSAPFDADTELTGFPKLSVWIAMDVPDTDFQAAIYEILPNGTSILLSQGWLRARYRESIKQEKLVKPGEVTRYDFANFTFFSRRIGKGSRIRLFLSCPNSIYVEKNYNSGGIVASETAKDARTAHITVYHDAKHPSTLELPLGK